MPFYEYQCKEEAHLRLQHQDVEHHSGLRQRLCSLHLKTVSRRQVAFTTTSPAFLKSPVTSSPAPSCPSVSVF